MFRVIVFPSINSSSMHGSAGQFIPSNYPLGLGVLDLSQKGLGTLPFEQLCGGSACTAWKAKAICSNSD